MEPGWFYPETPITREQIATILHRYQQFSNTNLKRSGVATAFADSNSISPYAREAVITLTTQGIITGRPVNLFAPQSSTTRAEVAAIFHRYHRDN